MSLRDELTSSSSDDNGSKDCFRSRVNKLKLNGNSSAIEVDDNEDSNDGQFSEKEEIFNHSSDDCNENSDIDHVSGHKGYKKRVNQSKSKVKIKTLTIDGQLVYFCKICDKIFTRRKDKLNHELAHSGESVLTCTECGKEYLHESSLASHMRTHAGDPLYMCDLCPKMFAQSHHLKTHILSHSEPTNFVCKTCYIEFPTSSDLNHHNRTQSKLEMATYWCKICKVYFCRSHKLTCDKRLHAFCCSACNELFYTQKKLKIHVKKFAHYSLDKPKHIEPLQEHELYPDKTQDSLKKLQMQKENDLVRKSIKNDINGKKHFEQNTEVPLKKFKLSVRKLILDEDQSSTSVQDSAAEVTKEVQIELKSPTKHRKGKPYCKKCNKSFKDSVDLDHHKAVVHDDKQDSFMCHICSMEFHSKDELDRHCLLHSGEHIHTCPVCGQEFLNSIQLTKHLRIHVGDFPYKCSQCGRAFRLKIQLIQHVRLHMAHDANTSLKCPQSVSIAQEHQDSYNCEADTFKCHLCSKKFLFRYKLLNHLRLHTNVKCFQCYVCHKTFATKCYLQRHLQVHVKQGMDVDVQNIIIDDDSKLELDSIKDQITKDYFQNSEDILSRNNFDNFEREDVKKPFVGIKRSISNFELACKAKEYYSSSWDKSIKENENQSHNISNANIKVEIQDHMDSISEHSFCSSFTRDSERSDPFKFSSDESYTFKTTMAKERRRLRRKLRKSHCHFMKSNLQALDHLKENDLNAGAEFSGALVDHEEDITDMVMELNTVKSEQDDVTTVFVNLTHKKTTNPAKCHSSSVFETGSSLVDNTSSSKFNLNIKDEIEEICTQNDSELLDVNPSDINNPHESANQTTSSGNQTMNNAKMLMFEFDVDLNGGMKQLNEDDIIVSCSKYKDDSKVIQENKEQTGSQIDSNKKELQQDLTKSIDVAKSVTPSKKKSPLKFITPDSSMVSESSNLGKLQAVFEHSSKYLPLPHTSSTHHKPPIDHSEVRDKKTSSATENDEMKSFSEYSSHDLSSSSKSKLPDQHTSVSQEFYDGQIRPLPSLSMQTSWITDSKQQEIKGHDLKVQQVMSSGFEPNTEKSCAGKISEKSSKSKFATSEILSANKYDRTKFTQKDLNESSKVNNRSINIASNSATSSHTHPDISSSNFPSSLMSHTINTANVSHAISRQSSHCSSDLISHPQLSLTNTHNYYPVIGNSGTDLSSLPSGINLHSSSVTGMNLNQLFGPVSTKELSTDTLSGTNPLNTVTTFGGCLISTNPLVNPSLGLNSSANQSLQFTVNHDCFNLNPSAIFDASNPLYRDMNMMHLLNTPSTEYIQNIATTNLGFLKPENSEIHIRHGVTAPVETQSTILQPPNSFMNFGNPTVDASGNLGNPLNTFMNQGVLSVHYGPLDNSVLHVRPGGFEGGDDSILNARNLYGPVYRDVGTFGNSGIPQLSLQMGSLGGQVPMNASNIFPLSTGNLTNISSLRAGSLSAPLSVNFADLSGSSLTNTSIQPVNQANFHCDFPLSIPTNPHVINNPGLNLGAFSTSGLQDSISNYIASSGINLFNTSIVPQNNGSLPGPSFINNFSTTFFPKF